mgnify:CR=1 FL=1|jgi:hypothetical protein|uniref:DUF5679 domain-containing protein n=1 Tax=viral metagenome TaxID=1070528 RepID=A0A6C0IMK3_9ZZZZ
MDVPKMNANMEGGKRKTVKGKKRVRKTAKNQNKSNKGKLQAYCVKCRNKVDIQKGKQVTMKNKRKAMKGVCAKCGTKVFRIM